MSVSCSEPKNKCQIMRYQFAYADAIDKYPDISVEYIIGSAVRGINGF